MIKVLFTIPNFETAGSGKALLNVAMHLNPDKFEVHIACMHDRGVFFKQVENAGIPIHIFQYTSKMKPYVKGLRKSYLISKEFKAIAPDIIHSFHYAADYSEPLAARLAGIKWIFTKKNMNWGGSSKNAWYLRSFLANAIVLQNTDMKKQFYQNSGKTHLIPRGVDTDFFEPQSRDNELAEQWQLHKKHRVLMCIANLVPIKGIGVLLRAFKAVVKQHADWKLMIVGSADNSYGREMIKLAQELDIKDHVMFCGKQHDIRNYLSLAEVVVLPTLQVGEGSPVSLLEAMSSAKNVLGSDVSGIRDQLQMFPTHLVQAGNITAWIEKLMEHCSNSQEKNLKIGLGFREHVINNYPIEKEVYKCERVYELVNRKNNILNRIFHKN